MSGNPRTISVTLEAHPVEPKVKMLHGANGCPKNLFPGYPDLDDQFNMLGIVNIRTHDWFGVCDVDGKIDPANVSQPVYASNDQQTAKQLLADISNKRTMVLDAKNSTGFNFPATDVYLKTVMNNIKNVDIMFRLGRSLSSCNIYPDSSSSLENYSNLVKTIVQRYSIDYEKYGLPRPVKYWEIGNEDDIGDFYSGTSSQFYDFFASVFKAAKNVNPSAIVGGFGVANPLANNQEYVTGFLKYCASNQINLDFFSWHHYCDGSSDPYDYFLMGRDVRKYLDDNNFKKTLSFMTEWNMTPSVTLQTVSATQTMQAASFICSALAYLQDAKVDMSYFYRCDAMHLGLFNKEHTYSYTAKAFSAFNRIASTPYRLAANTVGRNPSEVPVDDSGQDSLGYTVIAATNLDLSSHESRTVQILLSNYEIDREFVTNYKTPLFSQYSIDTSKSADSVDKDLYYGGQDPSSLNNKNDSTIQSDHHYPAGGLALQNLNYSDSTGLVLDVLIPAEFGYKNYHAKYEWVTSSSNLHVATLDSLSTVPDDEGSIPSSGTIILDRPELTQNNILLITLTLS